MFRENSQIGPYTLIRKLGRGGFGEVWMAERRAKFVTTKVAVKLPLEEQVDTDAIRQEATLWEQASGHPNVLPIIDADEYEGQIVIVSEYAPDGSLEEWLKQNGAMTVRKAIYTTIDILNGLEFLHSRHIIHRDLKPANILLQGDIARLTDFGISRAIRTSVSSQSKNVSGTFAYMAPEAFDGKRSVQTDIWSVGVNLYRFLTGRYPYPAKEPSALIAAIMMQPPEPLPDDVPEGVKIIIAKALAKSAEDRYVSAGEMRDDLRAVAVDKFDRRSRPSAISVIEDDLLSDETVVRMPTDQSYPSLKVPAFTTPKAANGKFFIAITGTLLLFLTVLVLTFNFGGRKPEEGGTNFAQQSPSPAGNISSNNFSRGGVPVVIGGEGEKNTTIAAEPGVANNTAKTNQSAVNREIEIAPPASNRVYVPANVPPPNKAPVLVDEPRPANTGNTRVGEPYIFSRPANHRPNGNRKP